MEAKNVIVFDTETTNSIDDPIVYDCGWAVINTGDWSVIKTESYAVADVFLDSEMMASAYYAEKIPSYWDEIKNGNRKLARLKTVKNALFNDVRAYGVTEIYAHNARFDYRSCTLTQRYLTCSKWRYFFPFGIKICDTLKMARELLAKNDEYGAFCYENGFMTANNQRKFTAEVLYRFISGEKEFEEVHKGLDDVMIEKEILKYCVMHGVENGALWE